jgi:hypothetical protein
MTGAPRELLQVAQIGFYSDPARRSPAQPLDSWPTLVDVAEAACRAGVRASVVQACSHSQQLARNGCATISCRSAQEQRPAAAAAL